MIVGSGAIIDIANTFANVYVGGDYSLLFVSSSSTYNAGSVNSNAWSLDSIGSHGNGFSMSDGGLFIVYNVLEFANGNTGPFFFDFEISSTNVAISDFVDGQVLWDSNGSAAGGETFSFVVNSVPEPTSVGLLCLGGLALIGRRKRS